jgi:hypothetical protein
VQVQKVIFNCLTLDITTLRSFASSTTSQPAYDVVLPPKDLNPQNVRQRSCLKCRTSSPVSGTETSCLYRAQNSMFSVSRFRSEAGGRSSFRNIVVSLETVTSDNRLSPHEHILSSDPSRLNDVGCVYSSDVLQFGRQSVYPCVSAPTGDRQVKAGVSVGRQPLFARVNRPAISR